MGIIFAGERQPSPPGEEERREEWPLVTSRSDHRPQTTPGQELIHYLDQHLLLPAPAISPLHTEGIIKLIRTGRSIFFLN